MKTAKTIIGIISIFLFIFITFQSCAIGIQNIWSKNGSISGRTSFWLAVLMLIAGIIGIATRSSRGGSIYNRNANKYI